MAWWNDFKERVSDITSGSGGPVREAAAELGEGFKELGRDIKPTPIRSFFSKLAARPKAAAGIGLLAGGAVAAKFILPSGSHGANDVSPVSQLGADAANRDFARDMAAMQAQAQQQGGGYTPVNMAAARSDIDVPSSLMAAASAQYDGLMAEKLGKTVH